MYTFRLDRVFLHSYMHALGVGPFHLFIAYMILRYLIPYMLLDISFMLGIIHLHWDYPFIFRGLPVLVGIAYHAFIPHLVGVTPGYDITWDHCVRPAITCILSIIRNVYMLSLYIIIALYRMTLVFIIWVYRILSCDTYIYDVW